MPVLDEKKLPNGVMPNDPDPLLVEPQTQHPRSCPSMMTCRFPVKTRLKT